MIEIIESHNRPLQQAMEERGYKLVSKPNGHRPGTHLVHYVDEEGEYVGYPTGYITGPSSDPNGRGFYMSVRCENGWAQRNFKTGELREAVKWALASAESALEEVVLPDDSGDESSVGHDPRNID